MSRFDLEQQDNRPTAPRAGEILLFSCVRDEILRLPFFFQYYRSLGVDRFFFVDNASSDGTLDYLLAQPDTHTFYTESSYASSRYGVDWLNELLAQFGTGHWVLVVDADELLVYPGCEHLGLETVTRYMSGRGEQAMMTFMLDMYGSGPISSLNYRSDESFIETCPYFDGDTYSYLKDGPFEYLPFRGGVRKRLFFNRGGLRGKPPVLHKIPLVHWHEQLSYEVSTHRLPSATRAEVSGVLLHFKLFSDFSSRVEGEVQRKEHWDSAAQYEAYGLELYRVPDLNAMYPGSVRYRDSWQLADMGFIRAPGDFPRTD